MKELLAQTQTNIGGPIRGFGPYGLENLNAVAAPSLFNQILSAIIGIMTLVAGIWFVFLLIAGAITWITSGGDSGKLAQARSQLISGVVGLAIVVAALFIIDIIGGLLGIGDILNPAHYIDLLGP